MELYRPGDAVIILTDADLIFRNGRVYIHPDKHTGRAGLLEAYAPWCGFCQAWAPPLKIMARRAKKPVYVINADYNRVFAEAKKLQGFPTFYHVSDSGEIGAQVEEPTPKPKQVKRRRAVREQSSGVRKLSK
jgi:thiol-disulfide isomerase/thioredoxin